MEWFNFKNAFPAFDEMVWFKEPGRAEEAYSSFLGWGQESKKPCFRSSTGHIVEVSKDTEWRYNQPERSKREDDEQKIC